MCGIFGLVQGRPFKHAELSGMSRLLRHRGPDDEGTVLLDRTGVRAYGGPDTPSASYDSAVPYCPSTAMPSDGDSGKGGVALGHRRLSILDLSSHGHQPMLLRDRYWISYNGEVYNYLELRSELQLAGYTFETGSDTEVILAAFDRWGSECLSRFNGMWAIAIVDLHQQTLFLARDRFGVKPLYYRQAGGRLAFASEIKAFSALEDWRARANQARMLDMLVWNISDHTAQTMFDGVMQLPAGHFAVVDLSGVLAAGDSTGAEIVVRPREWYSLAREYPRRAGGEAAVQLRELLDDAVRLRLRADVRVGSCLSGGLDSSTIVCLMSEQFRAQAGMGLHTFTACSHDAEFDESRYAHEVVKRSGATPHEVIPEPGRLFDELDRLVWHQDEPFVSTSIFAQWCVFQLARETGVTVMLDGQGADEILGGYRGFFGAYLAGLIRGNQWRQWSNELRAMRREIGFSYARSLGYTGAYLLPGLVGWIGRLDNRAYADRSWLKSAMHSAYDADPSHLSGARTASVRGMSLAQVTATNLPMLLHWEDRNSMAASVEARVPFLDYRVVELCLAMKDEDKLGGGVSKAALRNSMRGVVPDLILDRRDKLGFVTAERLWVTRDMATRFRGDLVAAVEAMPEVLAPTLVDQFDEVVAGRRQFDHRYWRAICTGRWVNNFGIDL